MAKKKKIVEAETPATQTVVERIAELRRISEEYKRKNPRTSQVLRDQASKLEREEASKE